MGGPAGFLFKRVALEDHKIGDIHIKKSTLVSPFVAVMNYTEKYYTHSYECIPERFLPSTLFPNEGWRKEPFVLMTFSAGPRNCIGQYLAMIEAKVIFSLFIKMFKFEYPKDYELKIPLGLFLNLKFP